MWRSPLTIPGSDVPAEDFIGRAGRYRLDNVGVGEKQMQYCPNCMIQIRGRKARCPLCQRELMDPDSWTEPELQRHPIEKTPEAVFAAAGSEGSGDSVITKEDGMLKRGAGWNGELAEVEVGNARSRQFVDRGNPRRAERGAGRAP